MQVNFDRLQNKVKEVLNSNLPVGQVYVFAKKVHDVVNLGNKELMTKIYQEKIAPIYERAQEEVNHLLASKAVIVPEHSQRAISIIFPNENSDKSGNFFEVKTLAEKLSNDDIERMVILGFFLCEERMTIIQAYNLIAEEKLV